MEIGGVVLCNYCLYEDASTCILAFKIGNFSSLTDNNPNIFFHQPANRNGKISHWADDLARVTDDV